MFFAALALGGCASMQGREPLQVTVADVASLPAEGLELRMMVKLRIQNPNDAPFEYRGVYVQLDVQDKTFATGVSDDPGSIGPFSEALVEVPVTVSFLRLAGHALSMLDGRPVERIRYKLRGKLFGPLFGSATFESQGDFALPGAAPP
jgi:LEA14-like dessication related protein